MPIGDHLGEEAVKLFNEKTVPELDKVIDGLVIDLGNQLHSVIERLNGAVITITINIPERQP